MQEKMTRYMSVVFKGLGLILYMPRNFPIKIQKVRVTVTKINDNAYEQVKYNVRWIK